MYTWVKARVKVLIVLLAAHKSFYGKVFVRWPDQWLNADTSEPRGTTNKKRVLISRIKSECPNPLAG